MKKETARDASIQARVLAFQIALAYQLMPRMLLGSIVVSTFLASLLWPAKGPHTTIAWFLVLNGTNALRYAVIRSYQKHPRAVDEHPIWARRAVAGSFLAGAAWGFGLTALAPPWGTSAFSLMVFIVAGVPAAGLVSSAPYFPLYIAFLLPILVPFGLQNYVEGLDPYRLLGGFLVTTYIVTLAAVGKAASEKIEEGFALRFENADLVEKLWATNEELRSEVARRQDAQNRMREAKEAAESANTAKSRFLAKMSHEIRTPVSGVLGMNELLRYSGLSQEQKRYADAVEHSARALLRIIDDILDFSRIEAGKLRLVLTNFDPRDAVSRAVEPFLSEARAAGVRLEWTVAPTIPQIVRGDQDRLEQVLVNLVGNALKFTHSGAVSVSVDGPRDHDACILEFRVSDTGIGISSEFQQNLFEPFSQDDESLSRRRGGTGLGLAICKQLVSLMGGDIWCESGGLGRGTAFVFTVRFSPVERGETISQPAFLPETEDLRNAFCGHVLVAEDNPVNSEVAVAQLQGLGLTVDSVEDGLSAVAAAARGGYGLILMDCEMPAMDGYEAARTIRQHEAARQASRVPIVALTASAMAGDRQRALEAGMDDYLSKPFTRAQLARTIAAYVPRRGAARDS